MSEPQAQYPMLPGGGDMESGGGSLGVYFAKQALKDNHWSCIVSLLEGRRWTEFKAKEQYLDHPGDTLLVGWPVSARLDSELDALAQERKARRPGGKSVALIMRATSERTGLSTSSGFDLIVDLMPENQASRADVASRLTRILPVDLPIPAAAVEPGRRTRNAGCSRKAKVLSGVVVVVILLATGGVALWKLKKGDDSLSPKRNGILLRHKRNNITSNQFTPYFTNFTAPLASKLINVTSNFTSKGTHQEIAIEKMVEIGQMPSADLGTETNHGRSGSVQEAASYSEPQPMTGGLPGQAVTTGDDETPTLSGSVWSVLEWSGRLLSTNIY